MITIDDIAAAFRQIEEARETYRRTLRAGLADGVHQVDISRHLGRTRETLRRDAMTDDELDAVRDADRRRKATGLERRPRAATETTDR